MSKRVVKVVKLQFKAGGARPGPALAGVGVNMPQFCSAFNDATRDRAGDVVPVVITAFEDKSFTFELKTSPASELLKKYAGVKSGSDKAHITKVGKINVEQLREIAIYKMPDLNANDVEGAMKIIAGTAKNMGIIIEGFGE